MAFTPTGAPAECHVLAEIVLNGTTLRYADEDIAIQSSSTVGYFYQGRMLQPGALKRQMNSTLEPRETLDTYDLVLDNRDLAIAALLNATTFANRPVNLLLGVGTSRASYSTVFPGAVVHPAGVTWDEDVATLTVADRRLKDRRVLPADSYTLTEFPYMEKDAQGMAKAIIYGDWSASAAGALSVPARCIDTRTQTFRVAGHPIKNITHIYKDAIEMRLGTDVTGIDLTTTQFSLAGQTYNACSDIVTVHLQGLQSANGTLIDRPGTILRSLRTRFCNVSSSALNGTALHDMDAKLAVPMRRYIGEQTSTETLVSELLNEADVAERFINGQYSPRWRIMDPTETATSFRDEDVLQDDSGKAALAVAYDPQRNYTNRVQARYAYDAVNNAYTQAFVCNLTTQQLNVCSVVAREWDFNWLYGQADVEARCKRELVIYGTDPISVTLGLGQRALLLNLGDPIDLTYGLFSNQRFAVQAIDINLTDMTAQIQADNVYVDTMVALWAHPGAADYTAGADYTNGYWTDDDGYIIPGDETTKNRSIWY